MILVVDDSPLIRSLVTAALSSINVGVCEADSGATALGVCERTPIDLVLLDVELPDANGLDVCANLKSRPPTAHIPVILMSGHGEEELTAHDGQFPPDGFLPKPFTLAEIRTLVRDVLAASH